MAIPSSKTELNSAISTTFDKLMADLERVPEKRCDEATMIGHVAKTTMSPSDLVAYLIGWNELVLKWLDLDDNGDAIEFPETGYRWNDLGTLAQKFYEDYSMLSWCDRLERLKEAKEKIAKSISNRSNQELYGCSWYGKWTKGRMIQLNTSSPYTNARGRIRKWLRETH